MAGLRNIEATTDDAIETISNAERLTDGEIANLSMKVVDSIADTARGMLVDNLRESGVGTLTPSDQYTSTGKMQEAVSNAIISVRMRGRVPVIVASMPTGISPYANKGGTKSNFYKVAASQSFGAVRTKRERREVFDLPTGRIKVEKKSVIGEKAKRTVKKFALGDAVSERAINSVEEGRVFNRKFKEARLSKEQAKRAKKTEKQRQKAERRSVKGFHIGAVSKETKGSLTMSGGAVVIKPRPFFRFKPQQQQELTELFVNRFMQLVLEKFGDE